MNERARRKAVIGSGIRYEECVEAVGNYLARCRRAGIALPDTLALEPWRQGEKSDPI